MASVNKVILIGRLGKDPELKYTPGGQAVANFSIATDEGYKDKNTGQKVDKTEWHNIVAWRQSAEFCGKYLVKGNMVYIEGRLQTRKWQAQDGTDRYSTEVVADRVQSLSPKNEQQTAQPQRQQFDGGAPGGGIDPLPF